MKRYSEKDDDKKPWILTNEQINKINAETASIEMQQQLLMAQMVQEKMKKEKEELFQRKIKENIEDV